MTIGMTFVSEVFEINIETPGIRKACVVRFFRLEFYDGILSAGVG